MSTYKVSLTPVIWEDLKDNVSTKGTEEPVETEKESEELLKETQDIGKILSLPFQRGGA
jgi:hypothetical protein